MTTSRSLGAVLSELASRLRPRLARPQPSDDRSHSWARCITSYDDVPGIYRSFFDGLLPAELQPFPYTVLTPTFKGIPRRQEREKLVTLVGGALNILVQEDGGLSSTSYPLGSSSFVERGLILLHSWITIHGPTNGGDIKTTTLRFNSVTEHLMTPFVECLRPTPRRHGAADAAERERFDYLAPLYYKFYSHGRASIRAGDAVQSIIFQPEMHSGQISLFGFSISRRRSPAHLTILTDSELIFIRDDDSQFWLKGPPHGEIWTYVPRTKIDDASIRSMKDGELLFEITLAGGKRIHSLHEDAQSSDLKRLVHELKS